MTDTPPASDRISTGIAGLDQLLRGGLTAEPDVPVEGRRAPARPPSRCSSSSRDARAANGALRGPVRDRRRAPRRRRSHGWSLDGIELFQLPAPQSSRRRGPVHALPPGRSRAGRHDPGAARQSSTACSRRASSSIRSVGAEAPGPRPAALPAADPGAQGRTSPGSTRTVLLLDDHRPAATISQLQSLAHGVIRLEQLPFEYGRARRRVRIVKFRGVAAIEGFHDFTISRGGVEVFPQIERPAQRRRRVRSAVTSGIAELDPLLGGGLPGARRRCSSGRPARASPRWPTQYVSRRTTAAGGDLPVRRARMRTFCSAATPSACGCRRRSLRTAS